MSAPRWVLIKKAAEVTGHTINAIQHKTKDGTWAQGKIWRKGPDGRIYINLEEFDRWVESAPQQAA